MEILILNSTKEIRERIEKLLIENCVDVNFYKDNDIRDVVDESILNPNIDIVLINIDTNIELCMEIIRSIKAARPERVIILFSGYSNQRFKRVCFDYGVDYFFEKPSDLNKMIEIIININNKYKVLV